MLFRSACNNSGEYYTKNGCEVPANSCTSWTENQCGKGRYCNFNSPATYTKNGSCNNSNEDYYTSVGPGTCSDITGVDTPNETNMATLTTAGFKNTFVTSGNTQMRWWSAASWCLGQGKHLIDVKEMRCYAQGTRLVEAGDTATYCCKDGQSCQQSSWNTSLWNGTTILEGKETEVAKFSDKIVALRKVYGSDKYFWTASPYGNTSQNSCNAFSVSLYYGGVNFNVGIRYDTNYIYALCE